MNVTSLEISQYNGIIESLSSIDNGLIVLFGLQLLTLLLIIVMFNRRV